MSDVNKSDTIPADANPSKSTAPSNKTKAWQMNALTEALGELTLTVTDSLSVGRGSDNDVVLGSKQVSRNHALLSVLNGELYVKDLDSSNGTFINDERIEGNKTKLLKVEDTVAFASFAFEVAPKSEVTEPILTGASAELSSSKTDALNPEQASTEQSAPVLSETGSQQNDAITSEAINSPVDIDAEVIDADIIDIETMHTENTNSEIIDTDVTDIDVIELDTAKNTASTVNTPVVENTVDNNYKMDSNHANQDNNIVKETMVDEVLTATLAAHNEQENQMNIHQVDSSVSVTDAPVTQEHTTDSGNHNTTIIETTISEPVLNEPVIGESIMNKSELNDSELKEPILQSEPVMAAEHDKTTTTPLQEEADPDILRAKQAATAQFSGTANLGESRDVGTQGNNAMDQALNNPATNTDNAQANKKPSGSWFIWVFVAFIIIGIALWLFNGGGV